MNPSDWFDDFPVIGSLPDNEAAEKLLEIGADDSSVSFGVLDSLFGVPAWKHTAHTFGHISPLSEEQKQNFAPIKHISQVEADKKLKNSRLVITLDGLRVADYPGSGEHRILFDFYGQNQVANDIEDLHFNATYRVREGERAAVLGFPIFVGLNVGNHGVKFRCFTINVKNTDDEAFLSMMDSDLFKKGLQLSAIAQPAIAPLTGLAVAVTKSIAARNRNVPVQDFYLGLDFGVGPTGARLAIGSYIAVQIPEDLSAAWDWREWIYQPQIGQIVNKSDQKQLIPYNYIIFGVNRYEE